MTLIKVKNRPTPESLMFIIPSNLRFQLMGTRNVSVPVFPHLPDPSTRRTKTVTRVWCEIEQGQVCSEGPTMGSGVGSSSDFDDLVDETEWWG